MSDTDDQREPELLDDRTIELMVMAARALIMVIYAVVLVTFTILALGFFLHLVGASNEASFVDWTYRNTEQAMQPFRGMFPIQEIDGRSVFDASLLFAAAFYGFFAIGLHAVVNYLTGLARNRHRRIVEEEAAKVAQQRADAVEQQADAVEDSTEKLVLAHEGEHIR